MKRPVLFPAMGLPLLLLLSGAAPAPAHVVSMSTGQLEVDGAAVRYHLSIPAYETQHMRHPEEELPAHILFRSRGVAGRLTGKRCRTEEGAFLCDLSYEFPQAVERLEVECTFPSLGIPTHVHWLRGTNGGFTAQAAFDASFERAELIFKPPSQAERALRQWVAGCAGTWKSVGMLLLLAVLALSLTAVERARTVPRSAARLAAALVAGQAIGVAALRASAWQPALRFGEAAAAVAAAYAAFEILLAPSGVLRWWLVALVGALQAARLHYLIASLDASPGWYLAGVAAAEFLALGGAATLVWTLEPLAARPAARRGLAGAAIAVSLGWFLLQL